MHRQRVAAQIHPLIFLEFVRQVINDPAIEILTPEERIAVCGQYFELVFTVDFRDLDDRDVEGSTTQIVHRHLTVTSLLVEAVGQRGGGRLVDNTFDVQAGDLACVLGCLALGIVEIGPVP